MILAGSPASTYLLGWRVCASERLTARYGQNSNLAFTTAQDPRRGIFNFISLFLKNATLPLGGVVFYCLKFIRREFL